MSITEDDVRFRACQRMTDFADGGGLMTDVVIVDGVDNNLFDDITDVERLAGRVSLRKIYAAVLNSGSETYLSAHAILDEPPSDASTTSALFAYGGVATERAEVVDALCGLDFTVGGLIGTPYALLYKGGEAYIWAASAGASIDGATGFLLINIAADDVGGDVSHVIRGVIGQETATYPPDGLDRVRLILNYPLPGTAGTYNPATLQPISLAVRGTSGAGVYGVARFVEAADLGAAAVVVENVFQPMLPLLETSVGPGGFTDQPPWSTWNFEPSSEADNIAEIMVRGGQRLVIMKGDNVVIHDTQSMTPATVSNGQTVDTGRVSLARLRVIGNNGTEHARFTYGQPAPTGVGCSADLTAGTVTFSDVSGLSQPVTIEHRIEEMSVCRSITPVDGGVSVGLNRPLARAYPDTARVSAMVMLGDMLGRSTNVAFAQTAWTGVWSDTFISSQPVADFNITGYPLECTNDGAITERWALIFTNTTAFNIVGEQTGVVGSGTTGADCEPINPATGAPYFTLPYLGWSGGWTPGNVYRFNTVGANVPIWALRCIVPSVPAGDDSILLQLRGYVNT